jgi:hypothetical protein
MQRSKLSLLLGLAFAVVAGRADALSIANGDLIVTLQKGGTELYVNLGNAFQTGDSLDLTSDISGLSGFGGSLVGAKVVGLAVAEPGRTVDTVFGTFPLENIIFTTLASDPQPTSSEIEQAMNATDTAATSTAWFHLLRAIAGNNQSSGNSASYESNLGLTTDAIGNRFMFSTAGVIGNDGTLTINVYSAVRGYEDFGIDPARSVELIGALVFGEGDTLTYVPEPGTLLLMGAGLLGLAALDRRTRRA